MEIWWQEMAGVVKRTSYFLSETMSCIYVNVEDCDPLRMYGLGIDNNLVCV